MTAIQVPFSEKDGRFFATFKRNDAASRKQAESILGAMLKRESRKYPGKILVTRQVFAPDCVFIGIYSARTPAVLASGSYALDGRIIQVRQSAKDRAETYLASRCD